MYMGKLRELPLEYLTFRNLVIIYSFFNCNFVVTRMEFLLDYNHQTLPFFSISLNRGKLDAS